MFTMNKQKKERNISARQKWFNSIIIRQYGTKRTFSSVYFPYVWKLESEKKPYWCLLSFCSSLLSNAISFFCFSFVFFFFASPIDQTSYIWCVWFGNIFIVNFTRFHNSIKRFPFLGIGVDGCLVLPNQFDIYDFQQ